MQYHNLLCTKYPLGDEKAVRKQEGVLVLVKAEEVWALSEFVFYEHNCSHIVRLKDPQYFLSEQKVEAQLIDYTCEGLFIYGGYGYKQAQKVI